MKKLITSLWLLLGFIGCAFAQPSTTTVPGTLLTYPFVAQGLWTAAPPTSSLAGFNLACSATVPSAPANGALWCTSAGLFIHTAAGTAGPIGSSGLITNGTPITGGVAGNVLYTDGSKLQAYAAVPLSIIGSTSAAATIPGNSMLGNWANATSGIGVQTMPPCADTNGNHLNYVGNVGITCGTSLNGVPNQYSNAGGNLNHVLGTPSADFNGGVLEMNCSSGVNTCTLTIPTSLPTNAQVNVIQQGAYPILLAASGTTIYTIGGAVGSGGDTHSLAQYTGFSCYQTETANTWICAGSLAP
jgi:hypothetical protein